MALFGGFYTLAMSGQHKGQYYRHYYDQPEEKVAQHGGTHQFYTLFTVFNAEQIDKLDSVYK